VSSTPYDSGYLWDHHGVIVHGNYPIRVGREPIGLVGTRL
jgi:hypothetical protein